MGAVQEALRAMTAESKQESNRGKEPAFWDHTDAATKKILLAILQTSSLDPVWLPML